jgi:hypothetical protein
MRTDTDRFSQDASGMPMSEETVRILAEELKAVRRDLDRQRRRRRRMSLALATTFSLAGWWAHYLFPTAEAQAPLQPQLRQLTAEQRAAQREKLQAELPAELRQELSSFERQVDWLTRYMQTWDEGTAGAVVALMLYRMSQSMDTMPAMEQQMRTMSAQMSALPAIVAELNQINAKMTVITGTMDSTMGRAGRMMPWMPFSP